MASGIDINPECEETYNDLKKAKKYHYIIFKMNRPTEPTEIVVDKAFPRGEKTDKEVYEDFVEDLSDIQQKKGCCYAVFDFKDYNKSIFYLWCPDESTIKSKMIYASSKDKIKKKIDAGLKEIQANDHDEISWENSMDKMNKSC